MAGITPTQRKLGWNVKLLIRTGIVSEFAGFYQQDSFLTISQVWRKLDLCFMLTSNDEWQPTLIPESTRSFIILEREDSATFPNPLPGQKDRYYFVYHNPTCLKPKHQHSLESMLAQRYRYYWHSAHNHRLLHTPS